MNCLPTRDLLQVKRVDCPSVCSLCLSSSETILHLFVDCEFTKRVWSLLRMNLDVPNFSSFVDWALTNMQKLNEK